MVGLFTLVSGLHVHSNHEVLLVYDHKRNLLVLVHTKNKQGVE